MEPSRLAAAVRARLPQSRSDRDGYPAQPVPRHLELVPFADGGLVDVPGEN
jgi:hypothetical protein